MHVAIVEASYSSIRLFEILLRIEGYSVRSFGKFEQLIQSQEIFDILLINPGDPEHAPAILEQLATMSPTRRIIYTYHNDILMKARNYNNIISLIMPTTRGMLMTVLQGIKPYEYCKEEKEEKDEHGT